MVTISAPASRRRSRISTRSASSVVRSSMAVKMRSPSGMARSGRSICARPAWSCSWLTRLSHRRDAGRAPAEPRGEPLPTLDRARPGHVSSAPMTEHSDSDIRRPAIGGRAAIRVGIIGAAGYVGGELIRLLERHPNVHIAGLQGRDRDHEPVTVSHPQLAGSDLHIEADLPDVDAVFLALPHGASAPLRPGARGAGAPRHRPGRRLPPPRAGRLRALVRLHASRPGAPGEGRLRPARAAPSGAAGPAGRRRRRRRRAGLLPHDVAAGPLSAGPCRAHRRSRGRRQERHLRRRPGRQGGPRLLRGQRVGQGLRHRRPPPHLRAGAGAPGGRSRRPSANPGVRNVDFVPHLIPMQRGILAACHVRPTRADQRRGAARAVRRGLRGRALRARRGPAARHEPRARQQRRPRASLPQRADRAHPRHLGPRQPRQGCRRPGHPGLQPRATACRRSPGLQQLALVP